MKKIITILFLMISTNIVSQNASTFFPSNTGYVWRYKIIPLDTLNNPIDSLVSFRVDSFATTVFLYNKDAKVVLSKTGLDPFLYEIPFLDSILYNMEGTNGNEYLGMNELEPFIDFLTQFLQDSTGEVYNFFKSFEGWKSYYRFANTVNVQYTVLQRDTTFTIDTLVLPLRFQILGRRLNDQTIDTEIGVFNCKKFTLERRLSYLINLPPPLPPLTVKIVGLLDTIWVAPQNWIVKTFTPSTTIDLNFIGLGSFTIPGFKTDIHNPPLSVNDDMKIIPELILYQNFPNPFNPITTIKWSSSIDGWTTLKIFDPLGVELIKLVDEFKPAGTYNVQFNSQEINKLSSFSSGVYFYQLKVGNYLQTNKMIILK